MTRKLVDGEYLSKLIAGSFEESIRRADEMVERHAELFGGGDGVQLQSWTFPTHVVVANSDGEFFRASLGVSEDTGEPQFEQVERVNVPVREARTMAREARETANHAVDAILNGDKNKALGAVSELYNLVQGGVRLTAEAVENDLIAMGATETEWLRAVRTNEKAMRTFVGADANKPTPQPRFENIQEHTTDDQGRLRKIVTSSLVTLKERLAEMCNSLALAREVTEAHVLRSGTGDPALSAMDYVEFVGAFDADLCQTKGIIEDAMMVSEDGDLSSLARIHDGVASKMYEMALAAAFCEKLARRFDAPAA